MNKSDKCPNCETHLEENALYCPHCGQSLKAVRLPFLSYLKELFDSILNFDNKFFSTLRKLLFSPGLVVKEFNENKKARFVPPLRLYLFLSFFFFLFVSGGVSEDLESIRGYISEADPSDVKSMHVSLFTSTSIPLETARRLFEHENITEKQVGDFLRKENIPTDAINNKILVRLVRLQRGEVSSEQVGQEFLSAASLMVFILMPLFALVLKICVGFKQTFYSETLVFSLYFHSLIGIIALLGMGLGQILETSLISAGIAAAIFFYLVFYIRGAFAKPFGKSILIAVGAISIYSLVFLTAFIVAILYSVVL